LLFYGKGPVAENYRNIFDAMADVEFQTLDRYATPDRVTDDSIVTFTLVKDGLWPYPVGQKVEMRLVHIFEMRDGKISKEIAFEMPRPVS
jgi:ketosteroid isomerase-like protein